MTTRGLAKKLIRRTTGLDVFSIGQGAAYVMRGTCVKSQSWLPYRALLAALLRDLRVDLVVDVGANEGQFGRMIRSFYDGSIFSFEPVPQVFQRLQQNTSHDARWRTVRAALGSAESTMTMHVPQNSVFSSLLPPNSYCARRFGQSAEEVSTENVTVRRLDEALLELDPGVRERRIFLKLDTQGYDLEVFRGAGGILDGVVLLQSEVSLVPIYDGMPHWTTSMGTFESAGYGVAGLYPVTRDQWRVVEFDCLMVRVQQ